VAHHGKLRVATLNVHEFVPAGKSLYGPGSLKALRNVAAWIRKTDPDVVVFNEIDDNGPGGKRLVRPINRLKQLVNGTDSAVTESFHRNKNGDAMGDAIITRHGVKIEHNFQAKLPNGARHMQRGLGIATLKTPDGDHATMMYAHFFAHKQYQHARNLQFQYVSKLVKQLNETGSAYVRDSETGKRVHVQVDKKAPIIFAGDLNQQTAAANKKMRNSTMTNAIQQAIRNGERKHIAAAPSHGRNRIDHIYTTHDAHVKFTYVRGVAHHATDHRGVVANIRY
jgi:endonuclease/exonuclease/phosphatase family metal-dependent hydrolase